MALYNDTELKHELAIQVARLGKETDNATKRSLGWRWPIVAIVFLTATVFCLSLVKMSQINADKDIRLQEITILKK